MRENHYIVHYPGEQFGFLFSNVHSEAEQRLNGVLLADGKAMGWTITIDEHRVPSHVLVLP